MANIGGDDSEAELQGGRGDQQILEGSGCALGRQVAATDALGNTTTNVLDLLGRTVKTVFPDGSYTATEYDRLGNASRQIGPVAAGAS